MGIEKQRQKYLRKRAVLSPWRLVGTKRSDFHAAVVIPALGEAQTLPLTLASLAANPPAVLARTLVVVVVNNRVAAPAAVCRDNAQTLRWLAGRPLPQLHLAWIDAATAGRELPCKEGVGLARRIGFDAALLQLDWERQPLLVALDADTLVEPTYLAALYEHFATARSAAAVIPFRHQPAAAAPGERAIRTYELYLRSYLFGLVLAGSPYAYHSIGSAFACRARGYIDAGGMNRRLAGEDFYFLQQLQKVGGVASLRGTLVRPAARCSRRVPFGTGQVLEDDLLRGVRSYRFIDAAAFVVLKRWLAWVVEHPAVAAAEMLSAAGTLAPDLAVFLEEYRFQRIWQGIQKNYAPALRLQAFHSWFDALRTRQLLTRLTPEDGRTSATIIAELLEQGGYPGVTEPHRQLQLLERLQGVG